MTKRSATVIVVVAVLATSLAACDGTTAVEACPLIPRPAVVVDAVDSASGAPITNGTRFVLVQGIARDSVRASDAASPASAVQLGLQRTGTFTLEVARDGYRPWVRTGIRVEGDQCGPASPALITARLQRL